ncbi:MAG: hypothetical protein Q7T01_03735 [bacterium]|nr:hypothetical protein [bacterium]
MTTIKVQGNGRVDAVEGVLSEPIIFQVTDPTGNPVPNVPVRMEVNASDAIFDDGTNGVTRYTGAVGTPQAGYVIAQVRPKRSGAIDVRAATGHASTTAVVVAAPPPPQLDGPPTIEIPFFAPHAQRGGGGTGLVWPLATVFLMLLGMLGIIGLVAMVVTKPSEPATATTDSSALHEDDQDERLDEHETRLNEHGERLDGHTSDIAQTGQVARAYTEQRYMDLADRLEAHAGQPSGPANPTCASMRARMPNLRIPGCP